jgi:hypothetical protein
MRATGARSMPRAAASISRHSIVTSSCRRRATTATRARRRATSNARSRSRRSDSAVERTTKVHCIHWRSSASQQLDRRSHTAHPALSLLARVCKRELTTHEYPSLSLVPARSSKVRLPHRIANSAPSLVGAASSSIYSFRSFKAARHLHQTHTIVSAASAIAPIGSSSSSRAKYKIVVGCRGSNAK